MPVLRAVDRCRTGYARKETAMRIEIRKCDICGSGIKRDGDTYLGGTISGNRTYLQWSSNGTAQERSIKYDFDVCPECSHDIEVAIREMIKARNT